ncbi:hypothetical protein SK128_021283, partial [Halocaridina rubra]
MKNCSVLNETKDSVKVMCEEGFDGGLPQSFIMEVYETQGTKLKSNVTSKRPFFSVRGLPSGLILTIRIYAANTKGRSEPILLAAATLQDLPRKGKFLETQTREMQRRLNQDDSSQHILKKEDSHSGRLDVDEKDPDVIPETR